MIKHGGRLEVFTPFFVALMSFLWLLYKIGEKDQIHFLHVGFSKRKYQFPRYAFSLKGSPNLIVVNLSAYSGVP